MIHSLTMKNTSFLKAYFSILNTTFSSFNQKIMKGFKLTTSWYTNSFSADPI